MNINISQEDWNALGLIPINFTHCLPYAYDAVIVDPDYHPSSFTLKLHPVNFDGFFTLKIFEDEQCANVAAITLRLLLT